MSQFKFANVFFDQYFISVTGFKMVIQHRNADAELLNCCECDLFITFSYVLYIQMCSDLRISELWASVGAQKYKIC